MFRNSFSLSISAVKLSGMMLLVYVGLLSEQHYSKKADAYMTAQFKFWSTYGPNQERKEWQFKSRGK